MEEPCPQGDHGEVHGEGAGEEGTGGDEHATPTYHEQQHPLGNRGTKLLQDSPEGEGQMRQRWEQLVRLLGTNYWAVLLNFPVLFWAYEFT